MKLAYTENYDFGGSPDIARENDLLDEQLKIAVAPSAEEVPRLDGTDPIDLEGLNTRTVRGFSLASNMTELH